MESNFIGISSKIIIISVLIQLNILKLKEKWFMTSELKFPPAKLLSSKEENQSKFSSNINLVF